MIIEIPGRLLTSYDRFDPSQRQFVGLRNADADR